MKSGTQLKKLYCETIFKVCSRFEKSVLQNMRLRGTFHGAPMMTRGPSPLDLGLLYLSGFDFVFIQFFCCVYLFIKFFQLK